jgi:S1-C subfamily serine protease
MVSLRGRLDQDVEQLQVTGVDEITNVARPPGARRAAITAVAAVALVLTAFLFYRWGSSSTPKAVPQPTPSASSSAAPTTAQIYAAVAPSTVSIQATSPGSATVDSGSGIIVNANGTIMTALHVVKGASDIRVRFADGTASAATVASATPATDIATLTPATLPSTVVPAVLGRSDRLAVGDSVIAIGDPLGLTRSTTTGVVSGLNRQTTTNAGNTLTGLIQFDAAVNPGNSGGPLLDGKGQTVGIVVALANPTNADTFIGIGFAVPITAAVAGGGGGNRLPQQ